MKREERPSRYGLKYMRSTLRGARQDRDAAPQAASLARSPATSRRRPCSAKPCCRRGRGGCGARIAALARRSARLLRGRRRGRGGGDRGSPVASRRRPPTTRGKRECARLAVADSVRDGIVDAGDVHRVGGPAPADLYPVAVALARALDDAAGEAMIAVAAAADGVEDPGLALEDSAVRRPGAVVSRVAGTAVLLGCFRDWCSVILTARVQRCNAYKTDAQDT